MILPNLHYSNSKATLYHYCDAEAFLSICQSKSIRFTDISTMNDSLEMHWGYSIWNRASEKLKNEIDKAFIDKVDEIIHESKTIGLVLASCFSLNKDILSQWRAYANDGKGYVIGFKYKKMLDWPVRPLKVLYDEKRQLTEIYRMVKQIFAIKGEISKKDFDIATLGLAFDLAAFKNPAFKEEKEVRLIHLLHRVPSNKFFKLVEPGSNNKKYDLGEQILFGIRNNAPLPYIELNFAESNPICEVIIGPKNTVEPEVISIFLETIGIESIKVSKSVASYR